MGLVLYLWWLRSACQLHENLAGWLREDRDWKTGLENLLRQQPVSGNDHYNNFRHLDL